MAEECVREKQEINQQIKDYNKIKSHIFSLFVICQFIIIKFETKS